jgi:hypothetical protein
MKSVCKATAVAAMTGGLVLKGLAGPALADDAVTVQTSVVAPATTEQSGGATGTREGAAGNDCTGRLTRCPSGTSAHWDRRWPELLPATCQGCSPSSSSRARCTSASSSAYVASTCSIEGRSLVVMEDSSPGEGLWSALPSDVPQPPATRATDSSAAAASPARRSAYRRRRGRSGPPEQVERIVVSHQ